MIENYRTISSLSFLLLISCFFFYGCKKLPLQKSKYYSEKAYNNEFFDYYDPESKIRYEFYNDNENFYFKMDTYEKLAKIKILSSGLKICIDTLSKTTASQFIHYPLSSEKRAGGFEKENVIEQFKKQRSLSERIDNLPKIGIAKSYKGFKELDFMAGEQPIQAELTADSIGNLVYELKFPIKYFFPKGYEKGKEFTLGIVTGQLDLPKTNNVQNQLPPPGRDITGINAQRARSYNRTNMSVMRQRIAEPIKVWFKTSFY